MSMAILPSPARIAFHEKPRPPARVRPPLLTEGGRSTFWFVSLSAKLDALPGDGASPGYKLLQALSLYEEGLAMQRLKLRHRFPSLSEREMDRAIDRWLARQDEAR
jgi:hypothetical protein